MKLLSLMIISSLLVVSTACKSTDVEKTKSTILKIRVAAGKALIQGCDVLGDVNVEFEKVRPYLPDDPKIKEAEYIYDMTAPVAKEICAKIKDNKL